MKKSSYNPTSRPVYLAGSARKRHKKGVNRQKGILAVAFVVVLAMVVGLVYWTKTELFGEGNKPVSSAVTGSKTSAVQSGSGSVSGYASGISAALSGLSQGNSTLSAPNSTSGNVSNGTTGNSVTGIQPLNNPILTADRFTSFLSMGSILSELLPSKLGFTTQIYKGGSAVSNFNRTSAINLYDPYQYQNVAGVLNFRGNNFRNAPSYGYVQLQSKTLKQTWERSMGGMASSSWNFSWSGTGWTGQPVMVQWSDEVRAMMNLNADKKAKKGLVEVITASMDGKLYFYDLDDGKATRPAINIGVAVKGTPAIDPRGYPILYVGQGDYPPKTPGGKMGFRIFNLIDQSLLYFKNTARDGRAFRPGWGALDSSPIIDAASDTLIYPCENGMIYTAKLNTVFDKSKKTVKITPEFVDYKYKSSITKSQGIESSIAVYGGYGYYADNSGTINCINLNTMKPVWSRKLDDDSDVTPTLQQVGNRLYLYCGTEVDNQKSVTGSYKGNAYVYKMDALTGAVIWKNSYSAYTFNDVSNSGNDVNGGIMGSMVVGKGRYSNLVIASICMSEGYSSGNTIAAFNAETGKLVWNYKMKNYSWSSPVDVYDAEGNLYVLMADAISQIHLIDGSNGTKLDVIQIKKNFTSAQGTGGGNIESSPAVFGNTLVIGTRGGLLAGVKLN